VLLEEVIVLYLQFKEQIFALLKEVVLKQLPEQLMIAVL